MVLPYILFLNLIKIASELPPPSSISELVLYAFIKVSPSMPKGSDVVAGDPPQIPVNNSKLSCTTPTSCSFVYSVPIVLSQVLNFFLNPLISDTNFVFLLVKLLSIQFIFITFHVFQLAHTFWAKIVREIDTHTAAYFGVHG